MWEAAETPQRDEALQGQQLRLNVVEAVDVVVKLYGTIKQAPPADFQLDVVDALGEKNVFDSITETKNCSGMGDSADIESVAVISRDRPGFDGKHRRIGFAPPEDRSGMSGAIRRFAES